MIPLERFPGRSQVVMNTMRLLVLPLLAAVVPPASVASTPDAPESCSCGWYVEVVGLAPPGMQPVVSTQGGEPGFCSYLATAEDEWCWIDEHCWGWYLVATTAAPGSQVWNPNETLPGFSPDRTESVKGGGGQNIGCSDSERVEFLLYDMSNPPAAIGGVSLTIGCGACTIE